MAGQINWDYVLKFIIIGDASVGKSSLLIRLTDQRFLANPDPTLGVEFGSKLIRIDEAQKTIKLQVWDTAGTESFKSITRSYYRGACGALVVYDVTSQASFMNARSWLADVREFADPNLSVILVGNKVDLCEPPDDAKTGGGGTISHRRRREVPRETAELWAREEDLLFLEASAKSGDNVEEAFKRAAGDVLSKIQRGVFDNAKSPGVRPARQPNHTLTLEESKAKLSCCG